MSLQTDPYEVLYPIKDPERAKIAAKKTAETRTSMNGVIGDETIRAAVLGRAKEKQLIAVFDGAEVVGILGFTISGSDFTSVELSDFTKQYGTIMGIGHFIAYAIAKKLYFGPGLYIAAFWVDPTRRGGGFGKKLLTVLRQEAVDRKMEMWTDVKAGNEAAFKFYEKQGFQPRERFSISALIPKYLGYQRICFDPNK